MQKWIQLDASGYKWIQVDSCELKCLDTLSMFWDFEIFQLLFAKLRMSNKFKQLSNNIQQHSRLHPKVHPRIQAKNCENPTGDLPRPEAVSNHAQPN